MHLFSYHFYVVVYNKIHIAKHLKQGASSRDRFNRAENVMWANEIIFKGLRHIFALLWQDHTFFVVVLDEKCDRAMHFFIILSSEKAILSYVFVVD